VPARKRPAAWPSIHLGAATEPASRDTLHVAQLKFDLCDACIAPLWVRRDFTQTTPALCDLDAVTGGVCVLMPCSDSAIRVRVSSL
jgi:hypothetical protein